MAGGGGSYTGGNGYTIPYKLSSNDNATYTAAVGAALVTFTGTSVTQATPSKVVGAVNNSGKVTFSSFTGNFQ